MSNFEEPGQLGAKWAIRANQKWTVRVCVNFTLLVNGTWDTGLTYQQLQDH